MRITIQTGIDASALQQAIYQTIAAGMECDAAARRARCAQLEKLAPAKAQRELFDEEEGTR